MTPSTLTRSSYAAYLNCPMPNCCHYHNHPHTLPCRTRIQQTVVALATGLVATLLVAACTYIPQAPPSTQATQSSPITTSIPQPRPSTPPETLTAITPDEVKTESPDATHTALDPTRPPLDHPKPSPAFAANTAFTADLRPTVSAHNASSLHALASITNAPPGSLYWSPDNQYLALTHASGVYLYDLHTIIETIIPAPVANIVSFSQTATREIFIFTGTDNNIYVHDLAAGKTHTLHSESAPALNIASSPTSTQIAVLRKDRTVDLWNIVTGELILTLDVSSHAGPLYELYELAYSPDGTTLAILSSESSTVALWDVATGLHIRTLEWLGHAGPLHDVAFSTDWETLAWVSRGTVQIMDYTTGTLGPSLDHEDAVSSWQFSPDGARIAVKSAQSLNDGFVGVVNLWDTNSGSALQTLVHADSITSLAFSSDWDLAATSSFDLELLLNNRTSPTPPYLDAGIITISQTNTGAVVSNIKGHTDTVQHLEFSPNADLLASASLDTTVAIWDLQNADKLISLPHGASTPYTVRFSNDGRTVVTATDDGNIYIWGAKQLKEPISSINKHQPARLEEMSSHHSLNAVSLDLSSRALAAGAQNGTITTWRVITEPPLQHIQGHEGWVYDVTFSPDGRQLASAGQDGLVRLWDSDSGARLLDIYPNAGEVTGVDYSPDGKELATVAEDGSLVFWDPSNAEKLRSFDGHTAWVWDVAFSPDGNLIGTASADRTIKLWDMAKGNEFLTFVGHSATISSLAISPDNNTVASGSRDHTSKLWDIKTGVLLHSLEAHDDWVLHVAFSPDGTLLVSTSRDGTFKVWHVNTGEELVSSQSTDRHIWTAAFSSDGTEITTASAKPGTADGGSIQLWGLHP